jgi:hypothetical protein
VQRSGERLGILAFFDAEPTSETYAQSVEMYPGRGEQLEFLSLQPSGRRR